MEASTLWLLVLSLATPIAGVVGFAIELRQVKKLRLENEKLQLEIAALKKAAAMSERKIVEASTEEVLRISRPDLPVFSKRIPTRDHAPTVAARRTTFSSILMVTIVIVVVAYAAYDLYRIFAWALGKL